MHTAAPVTIQAYSSSTFTVDASGGLRMNNGWEESASTWIETVGAEGDPARRFVLDPPMLERAQLCCPAGKALDVGCGEGRFSRLLASRGWKTFGIDPSSSLIGQAQRLQPDGDFRVAAAEHLPFENEVFDLVVAYMSLLDIGDLKAAVTEMERVLRPGGHLLIASLNSSSTAANPIPWRTLADGSQGWVIDNYMDERSYWIGWGNLRVLNWHRPLSTYMSLLLGVGLELRYFDEPMPRGGTADELERWGLSTARRVPGFLVMDWQKV
jgi:SAM-dependent methyltransferase